MGHPKPPHPEIAARLCTGWNLQVDGLSVQGGNRFGGAQRSLGNIERNAVHQVLVFAPEEGMILHAHLNVQVARRPAVAAHPAFAGDPHLHPIIHARRYRNRARAAAAFLPSPPAGVAGRFDGSSRTVAAGAGCGNGKLAEHAALRPPHLPDPIASAAGADFRTGLVPASGAGTARFSAGYFHVAVAAEHRLLEGQRNALADILAGSGLAGPASTAAKEGIENVAEPAEGVKAVKRTIAAAIHSCVSEAIIPGAFLLVAQHLIRLVNLFELVLSSRRFVPVRMKLHCLPAESASDILVVGPSAHTESFVIISGHNHFGNLHS